MSSPCTCAPFVINQYAVKSEKKEVNNRNEQNIIKKSNEFQMGGESGKQGENTQYTHVFG
jgi:hypothetical protein